MDPTVDFHPNAAEWDAFVRDAARGHFLQSDAWAALRGGQGWRSRRVALRDPDGGHIVLGAQVLVRGRRGLRMAYVPRGPVAEPDDERLPILMNALHDLTADCVFLRLEPHWEDQPAARRALSALDLRESDAVQPPSTVLLSLRAGPQAVLAGMKQKWRYNIRLAERRGVRVSQGASEGDWSTFEALVRHTASRNGFGARPPGYYRAVGLAYGQNARLYLARLEGEALAGILVIHWGREATYLYGGSSDRHRDAMPNHLLQWRAIEDAAESGLATYDFWGVPDALGLAAADGRDPESVTAPASTADPHDGLWGVWGFKRGFGGQIWRSVGAWDGVHAPLRYVLAMRVLPAVKRLGRRR